MSSEAQSATAESIQNNAVQELTETLIQASEAASRAVDEASPLERASRKGERDAYITTLANLENYADNLENYAHLEWLHENCRDHEETYWLKSISVEDASAHMVRKYNAQFQTYGSIADRIEELAETCGE